MAQHTVFTVRVADHEAASPERTAWRVRHAGDTLAIALAYFAPDGKGQPIQAEDGTFEIVAPVQVHKVRDELIPHEGLIIVSERTEPGLGIIVARDA